MKIIRNTFHFDNTDYLESAIRGLVWALADTESNEEKEEVEATLWALESELLNRGLLPADTPK